MAADGPGRGGPAGPFGEHGGPFGSGGGPGSGGPGSGGRGFGGFGGHGHGGFRGGPGGPGGPGGRRRRMRRGDVRAALLVLLSEGPRNGYGLMQEIEQRSGGTWRPSPGSVYPALALLEDEGLVRTEEVDGRRAHSLTDEGRAHVEAHRQELGEPWVQAGEEVGEARLALRGLVWQLGSAAAQVGAAGSDAQVGRASAIITDARKALYRLLAEDEEEVPADPAGDMQEPDAG